MREPIWCTKEFIQFQISCESNKNYFDVILGRAVNGVVSSLGCKRKIWILEKFSLHPKAQFLFEFWLFAFSPCYHIILCLILHQPVSVRVIRWCLFSKLTDTQAYSRSENVFQIVVNKISKFHRQFSKFTREYLRLGVLICFQAHLKVGSIF